MSNFNRTLQKLDYFAEFTVKKKFKYIGRLTILLMFIQIENKTMIEIVYTKLESIKKWPCKNVNWGFRLFPKLV